MEKIKAILVKYWVWKIFFVAFFALSFVMHPIHLTVSSIEYDAKAKVFKFRIRFFVDDFQRILQIKYGVAPDFSKSNRQANQLIVRYLSERLQIMVDGKNLDMKKLKVKRYWLEDIVLWIDLELSYRQNFNEITFVNQLMTDLYFDQKNLLIFSYGKKQFAFNFDKKHIKESIKL